MTNVCHQRIAMIGVAGLACAILCWWYISWPGRTAHLFVQLVAEGREGDWIQLVKPPCHAPHDEEEWLQETLTSQKRSWIDIATARQKFAIVVRESDRTFSVNFTVDFGEIFDMWPDWITSPNQRIHSSRR